MSTDPFTGRSFNSTNDAGGFAFTNVAPLPDQTVPPTDPKVEEASRLVAAKLAETEARLAQPMTAVDATALRNALVNDETWSRRYMEGSPAHVKQMEKLNATIAEAPKPKSEQAQAIEHMRVQYDLPPEAVQHLTENRPVTAAEKYAAAQLKRELMSQPEFVKAFLGGGLNEQRKIQMISIIIASPLADQ